MESALAAAREQTGVGRSRAQAIWKTHRAMIDKSYGFRDLLAVARTLKRARAAAATELNLRPAEMNAFEAHSDRLHVIAGWPSATK
jgi:hypothetical protein